MMNVSESQLENWYVHVCWYRLRDDTADLAATYLALAKEMFGVAVPTRFGTREPMEGAFPRDDEAFFDQLYREECDVSPLIFKGKLLRRGTITGWTSRLEARFQEVHLSFALKPFEKSGAFAEVEEFLVRMAQRSDSFFAFVELNDSPLDTAVPPAVRGAWAGLPSQPQWLTWYSSEYADMVRQVFTVGETREFPGGVLHRWTEEPAGEAEIRSWLFEDPWIPFELLPIPNPDNFRRPYEQAHLMPSSLYAPKQGSAEWRRIEGYYSRDVTDAEL